MSASSSFACLFFTQDGKKGSRMLDILLLFLASLCLTVSIQPYSSCLPRESGGKYRRPSFHPGHNTTGLTIEVSPRASHQILSRIVRILLKESLAYENVSLVNTSESASDCAFCGMMPGFTAPSGSMINVESWVPILYNLHDLDDQRSNVASVGPLGTLGRFAWYVSSSNNATTNEAWRNQSIHLQCGQTLQQSYLNQFASVELFVELSKIVESKKNTSNFDKLCGGSTKCFNGIYHSSETCRRNPGSCPILISSLFNVYGDCLVEYLDKSGLNVTVVWMGNDVYDFVTNKAKGGFPVMYFGWNMDPISVSDLFTPIYLPDDDLHKSRGAASAAAVGVANNCDWHVRPIHKMVWNKLKVYAPEVNQLLTNMQFNNSQISDLLQTYRDLKDNPRRSMARGEDRLLEETACNWVKKNRFIWSGWIPPRNTKTPPIYIGGLFSCTGKAMRDVSSVIAAELASEYINNDPDILPSHSIQVLVADTASVNSRKVNSITAYMTNKTHHVFGLLDISVSSNFEELVGSMSTVYSVPLIAHNAKSFALSQRNIYPYFFRTNSVFMDYAFILLEMFELFKWKKVGLFIEDSSTLESYHSFLREFLGSRNINVAFDSRISKIDPEAISDGLDQLKKKRVNIVVVALETRNMVAFLCQIYDKKMANSNNYSWLFVTLTQLVNKWWVNQYSSMTSPDCTLNKITEALQSNFIFHNAQLYSADKVIIGGRTSSEIMKVISNRVANHSKDKGVYPVSSEAFDAILVYSRAFHNLIQENSSALAHFHEEGVLGRFVNIVESLRFEGLTGPIKFKGADRSGVVEIMQMQSDDFVQVGLFKPEESNASTSGLDMKLERLVWRTSSGKAPGDSLDFLQKACNVETIRAFLGVECDVAIIIINVFVFGVILVPIILSLVYIKKRFDDKIKLINKETPQIVGWELTRNEIILNRKIGQGEFGTVFGGEAKIGQAWVAVAVKTLKLGSTSDDKVDFFSEARLMKDFGHENIVRLLGVCSIGDPGLVVMEFMLHGDLRSYLLSRRHLVNETSEEAMDVGPQAITKMALDVSRGLKYLTNLGFVHRDLACRNCLVHETAIVKIGDFGLTENVYNSGYVRCISNGKFPVRWMAPESLREGVFSSASDIWSLGVLFYEIFTFGALPYHGFSNEQVVVFVKNRKTIELPPGCPENLEKLLKDIWSYDSENRLTIDVIIDQLERMPLLLVPCLDAPRPQVGLDGSSGGNNGLIVSFMDPCGKSSSSGSSKQQKCSAVAKHKTSLSGMSLLNSGRGQSKFSNPEKSPDICSPQSTSAHCFDFGGGGSTTPEGQLDLIKASEVPKRWKEEGHERSRENSNGSVLRNSNELCNETKALLCNGCERPSAVPVLHRSVSTEPRVTAVFKKVADPKGNPDVTATIVPSGWTCKMPGGQPNSVCQHQNKRHSKKKNSAVSSSPAL